MPRPSPHPEDARASHGQPVTTVTLRPHFVLGASHNTSTSSPHHTTLSLPPHNRSLSLQLLVTIPSPSSPRHAAFTLSPHHHRHTVTTTITRHQTGPCPLPARNRFKAHPPSLTILVRRRVVCPQFWRTPRPAATQSCWGCNQQSLQGQCSVFGEVLPKKRGNGGAALPEK